MHSIHPYPGKFIPEIPRTLIECLNVPKDKVVLDPFCGSGVTLTEAQNAGYHAIGIDLNPIACLISRVKTTPLPDGLYEIACEVLDVAQTIRNLEIPNIPNLNHWFTEEVQYAVNRLVFAINLQKVAHVRDCLHFGLSSILVRVSNQESDTRYAAIKKTSKQTDVYRHFLETMLKIIKTLSPRKLVFPASILQRNILEVTPSELNKNIGLVITSPPYPNAYEYWLYHKYRMFWLGFDPIEVKKKEIGARAHYYKKTAPASDHFLHQLTQIFHLFSDIMESGYVCMVVGRSKIRGQIIDNASFVERAAADNGFKKIAIIERRIASARKSFNLAHAAISHEHLLIFNR
jgi:site-specific DNA-methyltransferase (cytosine-N4-specific)